jgi:hypothetical protein
MTTPNDPQSAPVPWTSPQPITGPVALSEPSPWEPGRTQAWPPPPAGWAPAAAPTGSSTGEVPTSNPAAKHRIRAVVITLVAVLGVVGVVGAATGGLVLGYNRGVAAGDTYYQPVVAAAHSAQAAAEQDRDDAAAERDRAFAERDAIKKSQAAQAAEDAMLPDLAAVAAKHFNAYDFTGDADYLEITIMDGEVSEKAGGLVGMLDELGFSSAVVERMSKTRALDGTQTAEGHNCNVSWTYHPDDGLQMVFESVANG